MQVIAIAAPNGEKSGNLEQSRVSAFAFSQLAAFCRISPETLHFLY
jgi:hypothetical protein